MSDLTQVKTSVQLKREWRLQHGMVITKECCGNCAQATMTDTSLGYCHKMARDLNVDVTHCSIQVSYVCDCFVERR